MNGRDYWANKRELAFLVNQRLKNNEYVINENPTAHDICSLFNQDMAEINDNPEIDKFILLRNNQFKIATAEEAKEEVERLKDRAMRLLVRMSKLSNKIKSHGQGKLLSNRLDPIDEESRAREYIETFIN